MKKIVNRVGWVLMGYPMEIYGWKVPGWQRIYGWGATLHNWTPPKIYTQAQLRDPATIVQVLKDLGWYQTQDPHQYDCPRSLNSGNICQCVPPAATWSAPSDVDRFLGNDWETRRDRRRAQKART